MIERNMDQPTVSVVIPTHRRPEKLARSVESIVAQTCADWELLIVNDAPSVSVDGVLPDDGRISYLKHERNRGAPAARNTGIGAAEGEFIALLDDDDAWQPEKLDEQLRQFRRLPADYGMVYTGREIVRDGDVVNVYTPEASGRLFDRLLAGNIVPSETPLIRHECFERVGTFDTSFRSFQDLDMWLRIAREYRIGAINEALAVAYRGHGDRISTDMHRKYAGLNRLLEKYKKDFRNHPEVLSQRYKTLGIYAINSGRPVAARDCFCKSIRLGGRDPLTLVYLLACHAPGTLRRRFFSLRRSVMHRGFIDTLW
jgi:glycosyltransferase involved in cell wall biosynthesis